MVRAVAVFWMSDEKGPDAKVLCVPAHDPRWNDVSDLPDVAGPSPARDRALLRLLQDDRAREGRTTRGWEGATAAESAIADAKSRHHA